MSWFRRRRSYKIPPSEISDAATHSHVGADMITEGDELTEAADEGFDAFGADAEKREQDEVAQGATRREQLESEHGADYHGFGHPPDDSAG